jgi:AcrR family transcriptional regulator
MRPVKTHQTRVTPRKTRAHGTGVRGTRSFERGVDDTRGLLLAAARDVFLEDGPERFSLREVARRVGVSAAAVYRHFADKDALLFAACTQGFQVFSSYLVRALGEPTPLDRLRATGDLYRLFALENPLDYRFIFMSQADKVSPPPPKATTTTTTTKATTTKPADASALPQDTTFRFLVDRVRECMQAGILVPGEVERVAVAIWAYSHGVVALRLSGHLDSMGDDEAFTAFYRASTERFLTALSP